MLFPFSVLCPLFHPLRNTLYRINSMVQYSKVSWAVFSPYCTVCNRLWEMVVIRHTNYRAVQGWEKFWVRSIAQFGTCSVVCCLVKYSLQWCLQVIVASILQGCAVHPIVDHVMLSSRKRSTLHGEMLGMKIEKSHMRRNPKLHWPLQSVTGHCRICT